MLTFGVSEPQASDCKYIVPLQLLFSGIIPDYYNLQIQVLRGLVFFFNGTVRILVWFVTIIDKDIPS